MSIQYTIAQISAIELLSAIVAQNENGWISYDAEDPSIACRVKWTKQDDCPMFYQALQLIGEDIRNVRHMEDSLSQFFVYIDFSGIFDRKPLGRVAELQRKAQWLFRPDGIEINLNQRFHRYIAFERSASMSRNSKLCFVRAEIYEQLKERMMLGMTIGKCQLSKLYAYNGLMFTGGRRLDRLEPLNERRIIVIDNPKTIIPNVKTITVEDDGYVNLFIGKNNCGKSSVLDVIGSACRPMASFGWKARPIVCISNAGWRSLEEMIFRKAVITNLRITADGCYHIIPPMKTHKI